MNAQLRTTAPDQVADFKRAVVEAMNWLAADPRTVFVGQSVRYDGAAIYHSLDGVPMERRIEFPVAENLQLGYCTGLSLCGRIPVCIFPRMDFMLEAMSQLVQHLDKLPLYGWQPKVIIRCRVGEKIKDGKPLDAGPQHTGNYCSAFRQMLTTIDLYELRKPEDVMPAYRLALESKRSTIIAENPIV